MRDTSRRTRGFTLFESVVVLAIVSVIAVVAGNWLLSAGSVTNELNAQNGLLGAERGLAVMEDDIRNTSFATGSNLAVVDSFTLTFSRNTGYDMAKDVTQFGQPITYKFVVSAAATKDLTKAAGTATTGYQLTRSFNGGPASVIMDSVTNPGFGLVNGCITVDFNVARSVAHGQTGRSDYRKRPISRSYRIPGAP